MITQATLDFFAQLQENNNRPWFEARKSTYLQAKREIEQLMHQVQQHLEQSDVIEYAKLFRLYRDVRFSKNKLPYKSYLGGYYRRFGAARRGSYAFDIEPGKSRVGGGFWGPNTDDLLRIRKEFEMDISTIEGIVQAPSFVQHFGQLQGNGVKTAPRGFDKTHPHIYWIRKKQFYAYEHFPDSEVIRPDFADQMTASFLAIRPFFDYMTDVLTTDMNGVSIL
ncbi:MAG: DUF2461 domain-containing protein [Aureispira sp.]